LQGHSGRFDDGLQVFQYLFCLNFNIAFNKVTGFWIYRNLSGDEKQISILGRLRVWSDGSRCLVGGYN
jgi:hypothetical protein